uniref:26S proteasome non-ATPase regulatory subunit 13 n=1 Tax=Parastrongyloides trichosuri TaxID=131310 RepID=A0A0N5A1D4_PARTI
MYDKVDSYLSKKAEESLTDDQKKVWSELLNLHSLKHWHQFSQNVVLFLKNESLSKGLDMEEFWKNVILTYKATLAPYSVAVIARYVAHAIFDRAGKKEAYTFLDDLISYFQKDITAVIRLMTTKIEFYVKKGGLPSDGEPKPYEYIAQVLELVETCPGKTDVLAWYYLSLMEYYRQVCDYTQFYRAIINYLNVADSSNFTNSENIQLYSYCMCEAAVLSPEIYDLGECYNHNIHEKAINSSDENRWVHTFVRCFVDGDMVSFNDSGYKTKPNFAKFSELLERKIRLCAALQLASTSPTTTIPYNAFVAFCDIPIHEVEYLLMKAVSKKLIKGKIDEVGKVFMLEWIKPRCLGKEHLGSLYKKYNEWRNTVQYLKNEYKGNLGELRESSAITPEV